MNESSSSKLKRMLMKLVLASQRLPPILFVVGVSCIIGALVMEPPLKIAASSDVVRSEVVGQEGAQGPPQVHVMQYVMALEFDADFSAGPEGATLIHADVDVPYVRLVKWRYSGRGEEIATVRTPLSETRGDNVSPVFFDQAKRAAAYLLSSRLVLSLHLAGVRFEPKGPNPVGANGTAHWSVSPDREGDFEGFLRPAVLPAPIMAPRPVPFPDDAQPFVEVIDQSLEDIPITLKVHRAPLQTTIIYATAFLGSLLTVPGLLAFMIALRDELQGRPR